MVPEQETELLGLLCLLHRHACRRQNVGNEGQITLIFFWGGGGGGVRIYDAYPRNLPDFPASV